jgi:hypothetical protein
VAFWNVYTHGAIVSPLLFIPGFNVYRVVFDIMHCLELGVGQYAVASAMMTLTEDGAFPGATRDDRWAKAYEEYDNWCIQNKVRSRCAKFKWSQFHQANDFPHITQLVMKAAALRTFFYFLEVVCLRPQNMETQEAILRATMIHKFCELDRLLRSAGKHLTAEQRESCMNLMEAALLAYFALNSLALRANKLLWKQIPKLHALMHIAADFGSNPRRQHCYGDEDMIGRAKKLYNGCHGLSAPRRCLQRYIIIIGLRWLHHVAHLRGVL